LLPDIVEAVRARTPPFATRIVAVDGPGGAGKSTFAARLASAFGGVPVAHTDDFASWEVPVEWWPRCIAELLEPLARGETARYEVTPWDGVPRPAAEIPPGDVVILEGVTASRIAFRPFLTYAIWIETPPEIRLERGVERDGEQMREQWVRSMAAEDGYVARENPVAHADLVVQGV
jgi:uridine kinase